MDDDELTQKERIQLFASFLIFCAIVVGVTIAVGGYLRLAFP